MFKKAVKKTKEFGFDVKWKHISATAGAGKLFSKEFNFIRLGLGLYGESSLSETDKAYKKSHFEKLKPYLSSDEYDYLMTKGNKASHLLSLQSKDLLKLKLAG